MMELAREGYPFVSIETIEEINQGSFFKTLIEIETGYPFQGRAIYGWDLDGDRVHEDVAITSNSQISAVVREKLVGMTDSGFPFAKITLKPREFEIDEDTITGMVEFELKRDSFFRLNRVRFPGYSFKSIRILALESRLRRGDVFSDRKIKAAQGRIKQLEFVKDTGSIEIARSGPGLMDISIPVVEERLNRFSGILAVNQESSRLMGDLSISWGNILGTGRSFNFAWHGLETGRTGISVSYREPWLMEMPVDFDIGFNYWLDDTLSLNRSFDFGLIYRPLVATRIEGNLKVEQTTRSKNEVLIKKINTFWYTLSGEMNYLDYKTNPGSGFLVASSFSAGVNQYPANRRGKVRFNEFKSVFAYSLSPKLVFFARVEFLDIAGDVPFENLIRTGGQSSLRGYDAGEIIARGIGMFTPEIRWKINQEEYAGIFLDAGRAYRPDRNHYTEETPVSFGLTGSINTNAGRISLDLGLAKNNQVQQAILHFRVEGWF